MALPPPPSPELPPEVLTLPLGDSSRSSFLFLLISSTALTTRPPLSPDLVDDGGLEVDKDGPGDV